MGLQLLVVLTFPVLLAKLGLGGVFAIYAAVCVAGLFFTARYVPETSGLTLEEIEAHLKAGKPFHRLGEARQAPEGQRGRKARPAPLTH